MPNNNNHNLWRAFGLAIALAMAGDVAAAAAAKAQRDARPPVLPAKSQPDAPAPAPQLPKLTAEQIAERNAQARGGLKAWRAVQSLQMTGLLDAGGRSNARLPFTLQMKRPHYQRVTIEFAGQTAVQVFDGQNGWKLRPFLNRNDTEPFSEEERTRLLHQDDLDGPLIDYAAKGSRIELDGTEMVESKANYRLKLTTRDGYTRRIWIDGTTFLESKMEGNPRRLDGKMRHVENFLRDWRRVQGVMIPFISESHAETARLSPRMTVEKVVLNPQLADSLFAKPVAPAPSAGQAKGVTAGSQGAPTPPAPTS
jgi:outer membrane lipoprotein-sorting protein